MRIIQVTGYFTPQWKYQENYLAREQVKLGHEVHVITSDLNLPPGYKSLATETGLPKKKMLECEQVDGYTVHNLPVLFELSGRVLLKGVLQKIKELKPELVICHGISQPFTLQILFGKPLDCRIIADEHVLLSDVIDSPVKKFFLKIYGKIIRRRLFNRVSKLVAISNGVKLLFTTVLSFPEDRIHLITLGTDTDEYRPDMDLGVTFRKKYGIKENALLVGYTGKIAEYKKVHFLIDAANDLGYHHVHILLVGSILGDYTDFLNYKISQSKVPVTRVKALASPELVAVYNACDILAWPAHQTISTVNASACGKPIICSDYLKERYQAGQGIGVEPGNYPAFKNALDTLLSNKEIREDMGRKGREWAANEVSWTMINKRFIE